MISFFLQMNSISQCVPGIFMIHSSAEGYFASFHSLAVENREKQWTWLRNYVWVKMSSHFRICQGMVFAMPWDRYILDVLRILHIDIHVSALVYNTDNSEWGFPLSIYNSPAGVAVFFIVIYLCHSDGIKWNLKVVFLYISLLARVHETFLRYFLAILFSCLELSMQS